MKRSSDSGETGTGARRRRAPASGSPGPRIEDVARLAGVSSATVSRVLNGTTAVTPGLCHKVLTAVDALGYVPHGPARALAMRRSNTIGAIIPTIDNAIFARGVRALQNRLFDCGYTLLLASSDYDFDRERREAQALLGRGIDGLMMVGELHDHHVYELLAQKHVPYVNIWLHRADSAHPCVGFDNEAAAYQIANYLLELGHTRIAMVAGIRAGNDRAQARVDGVTRALRDRGLFVEPGLFSEQPYEIVDGRRAAAALLDMASPPTAIVCGNDILAMGVLFECKARNWAVPEDVSVTGFDDLRLVGHLEPPLTTIRVPCEEMGCRAADYLMARIEGRPTGDKIELDVELQIRGTTAPPRQRLT